MDAPLLEVEDLTIQYETQQGMITAVSNASFTVEEGEYFGVVGESGCGKSTLAKSIVGLLDENGEVTSGTISYKGDEIQDLSEGELSERYRWNEISVIPQSSMNNLDPLRPIHKQAKEIAKVNDVDGETALDRLRDLFSTMGLEPDRITDYPDQFSGGMQQRAIIAFSLLLRPSLVIADEPTTALDVIVQDQVFKHIDQLMGEWDTSMMLITHDISLVFENAAEMMIMHGGQVAEVGSTSELFHTPQHPYSILLQKAFPDHQNPDRELHTIEGKPPRSIGEVDECTFADRCPWALEECRHGEPELEPVDSRGERSVQRAACVRKDENLREEVESGTMQLQETTRSED